MIFVDTGAWFAAAVPGDRDHRAAREWLALGRTPLVTTDYVIDELLTLMKARGEFERALRIGAHLVESAVVQLEPVQHDGFLDAWEIFHSHRDKGWSFTDCTSLAVMRRLGISAAFSFDHHFRQFGDIEIVP